MRTAKRTSEKLAGAIALILVAAAAGTAYARTLAPSITWANNGADSGDLVTAAATLGVAHPTGYPTYLLLARLFQLIPAGDLAFRANLLSAAAAIGAALVVGLIVSRLNDDRRPTTDPGPRREGGDPALRIKSQGSKTASQERSTGSAALSSSFILHPSSFVPAIAALALALAPAFWAQAVIAEVYTLNALFFALLLLFALGAAGDRRPAIDGSSTVYRLSSSVGWLLAQGIVAGLALGNHVTVGLAVLAWLAALAWPAPRGMRPRRAGWALAGLAIGLLVYLYLPLRARASPPVNWGDPRDLAGFWWTISGALYRGLAFGLPAPFVGGRLAAWAGLLVQQFGWLGLALGCAGLIYGAPARRSFVWLTAALAAAMSAFAIGYDTTDSSAYLIPFYLIFAIWIGLGAARLLAIATRWGALVPLVITVGLLAWFGARGVLSIEQVDASQDRRATEFAERVLAAVPASALVITSGDRDTFALWYARYALGRRPDVAVVVEPLMQFDWYRANLRAVEPRLRVPEATPGAWAEALAAENGGAALLCRTDAEREPAVACGK